MHSSKRVRFAVSAACEIGSHACDSVNRTPDITDVFALHAVTAFKFALETADSKDPMLVQQALVRGVKLTPVRSERTHSWL